MVACTDGPVTFEISIGTISYIEIALCHTQHVLNRWAQMYLKAAIQCRLNFQVRRRNPRVWSFLSTKVVELYFCIVLCINGATVGREMLPNFHH